jgi:hypothetical protein
MNRPALSVALGRLERGNALSREELAALVERCPELVTAASTRRSMLSHLGREKKSARPSRPTAAACGLADTLEATPELMPLDAIRAHAVQHLRGEIKRRRGPKALTAVDRVRDAWAGARYTIYVSWLRNRQRKLGLKGCAAIRDTEWWDGAPHERAVRMVQRRFKRFGFMTPE